MAQQLIIDMHGCRQDALDDVEALAQIAHAAISSLGAHIIEECVHKFDPIGISYIAVISTSHFSIHTWPEFGYAAVDVFSCTDDVPEKIACLLEEGFHAKTVETRKIVRQIGE
jgi:S-adenosylmethionine decarboxylase